MGLIKTLTIGGVKYDIGGVPTLANSETLYNGKYGLYVQMLASTDRDATGTVLQFDKENNDIYTIGYTESMKYNRGLCIGYDNGYGLAVHLYHGGTYDMLHNQLHNLSGFLNLGFNDESYGAIGVPYSKYQFLTSDWYKVPSCFEADQYGMKLNMYALATILSRYTDINLYFNPGDYFTR